MDYEYVELPSDSAVRCYRAFEGCMLVISATCFLITVCTMLKSSTRAMKTYRYYLLNELCWSLLCDLSISIACPISLFPIPCGYAVGWITNFPGNISAAYMFMGLIIGVGRASALTFQFLYRFFSALPPGSMISCGIERLQPYQVILIFVGQQAFAVIVATIPFYSSWPDQDEQKKLLFENMPFARPILKNHGNIVCVNGGTRLKYEPSNIVTFIIVLVLLAMGALFGVILMYSFLRRANLSPATFKLQMMLFWSLVAQFLAVFALMVVPAVIWTISPVFGILNGPIVSMFFFSVLLTHTTVDCAMILYFIKPYRRFLKGAFIGREQSDSEGSKITYFQTEKRRHTLFN
ncbi:unnamed protein product [Bursaphelenchus xylophilus]|uniref:(pine wood nematode) hypothetical protein n=1 Tax=Bursaphelenchus xylophilus TaxID=6326 RepID=A0A1I7RK29_BURXY|nr:unnamed protein product [Bursaphelenchus xylophilus]CAG9131549.1 unnamed protein product [Bursaphelenchus xylophilus]